MSALPILVFAMLAAQRRHPSGGTPPKPSATPAATPSAAAATPAAAAATPPKPTPASLPAAKPWPAAAPAKPSPAGLPKFPTGWEPDTPPSAAVVARAYALLPTLWKSGKPGATSTEQTDGQWKTYQAYSPAKGKRSVVAYRLKAGQGGTVYA